jgi:mitochondrial-processing peptidase subunit alpha
MHSRLYTRVLNQHHWVHNASAFSSVYDHTGLAGIHITTESGKIEQGVDIACKELQVRWLRGLRSGLSSCCLPNPS